MPTGLSFYNYSLEIKGSLETSATYWTCSSVSINSKFKVKGIKFDVYIFVINKCSLSSYPSGLGEGIGTKGVKGTRVPNGYLEVGICLIEGQNGARFGIENIHGMPKIMIHWD